MVFAASSPAWLLFADIYIGLIGFFTGLLAVSTSAQLFLSHLVLYYVDAFSPVHVSPAITRNVRFLLQIALTVIVGLVVLIAPYADASRVVMGDRASESPWSPALRVVVAIIWTFGNVAVLCDTFVFSIASVVHLCAARHRGAALLVLLSAAGSSDLLNRKRVRYALSVAARIDRIAEWTPPKLSSADRARGDRVFNIAVRHLVRFHIDRMHKETDAAPVARASEKSIASALSRVGASPPDTLSTVAMAVTLLPGVSNSMRPVYARQEELVGAFVASQLTPEEWDMYHALLNAEREPEWRLNNEKSDFPNILPSSNGLMSVNLTIVEPRVAALDVLHTFRRVATWPHGSSTRQPVLQWARARALAEWVGSIGMRDGFMLQLYDGELSKDIVAVEEDRGVAESWFWPDAWGMLEGYDKPLSFREEKLPGASEHIQELRKWLENWMSRVGNHRESHAFEAPWVEDRKKKLDRYEHGSDWAEVKFEVCPHEGHADFLLVAPGQEKWDYWEVRIAQDVDAIFDSRQSLFSLLDVGGVEEDIGGQPVANWFALCVVDMVMCYKELLALNALKDPAFALALLGLRVLALIRVATKRSGRRELLLRRLHSGADMHGHMSVELLYSLGDMLVYMSGDEASWERQRCASVTERRLTKGELLFNPK